MGSTKMTDIHRLNQSVSYTQGLSTLLGKVLGRHISVKLKHFALLPLTYIMVRGSATCYLLVELLSQYMYLGV